MAKFRFTYTYDVVVDTFDENEGIGKAAEILGTINELSLKLWLVTHYSVKEVIEGNGVNLDNFPL